MQGSVSTARGLLANGNCYGFVCSQIKCPLNTVVHPCNGNRRKLNHQSIIKLQEFIKENEKMTKEDQIIEVVTAFKAGKTIRYRHKGEEAWKTADPATDICAWDFNNYQYEVAPEPQYRPLSTEELSCMVGTVLATKDRGFHILTTAFNPISKEVFLGKEWCDAARLYDLYLRLDGSPVGVLIK